MRDSRNRRKVKDIAQGKRDAEGKMMKNHLDALSTAECNKRFWDSEVEESETEGNETQENHFEDCN